MDFLPTIGHLTGTPYDKKQFEGRDVSDVWLGKDRNPQRLLYWKKQFPTALDGQWKYHVNKRGGDELYKLTNDPSETTNVIDKHPERAKSLLRAIKAWDESLPPLPGRAAPPKRKALQTTGNPKRKRGTNSPAPKPVAEVVKTFDTT